MRFRKYVGPLLGVIALFVSSFAGTVSAAGTAAVTIESGVSGVAGSQQDFRLYVTPAGAPLYTVQTTVNLTNMTYISYAPNGTYFAGANQVYSTNGTTQITIGASHQGLNETAAGVKAFIGTIRVQLGGSAGTATASQTGAKADDAIDVSPMSPVSSPSRSMTITAAQSPTCPAGQTGTPPNCTIPSSGGGGGGGGSGSTTTNPINNPTPGSSAVVPTSAGTPESPTAEVVSEDKLSQILTGSESKTPTEKTVATTTKAKLPIPLIAGSVALLVVIGVAAKLILTNISRSRTVSSHSAYIGSNTAQPTISNDPEVKSPDHTQDPPQSPDGPTIIKPGQ